MTKLKLEYCKMCDEPTGRAGAGDDSIYLDDGRGPLCERCYGDFKSADMLAADADAYAQGRYDEEMRQGPPQSVWDGLAADAPEQEPVAYLRARTSMSPITAWEFCVQGEPNAFAVYRAAPQARELSNELADERLAGMAAMAVWEEES